jgi:hypothetical protein
VVARPVTESSGRFGYAMVNEAMIREADTK